MLLGIMADSHDNLVKIEQAVNFFNRRKVDLVLHAGDFVAPFVVRKLKEISCPFIGVFGNNDGERKGLKEKIASIKGEIHTPPYSFVEKGKKILLLHDPAKLKGMDLSSFQLVIYGHTHRDEVKKIKETVFVNPGECGGWLTGKSTVALVDLETMQVSINSLD
ncbi:YfcE family phosphodiesterase [Candidatus Aerophobetes bacterium]|uniref:Phosphoesterase n=1 Tax=Aerophobetes bacterium TaxID=2030807 RepID=A0A662DHT9_UNCAE|nr:MAG: YfcE family phosphodiesterase [Candidatus Aerophobetes bacterium]